MNRFYKFDVIMAWIRQSHLYPPGDHTLLVFQTQLVVMYDLLDYFEYICVSEVRVYFDGFFASILSCRTAILATIMETMIAVLQGD